MTGAAGAVPPPRDPWRLSPAGSAPTRAGSGMVGITNHAGLA